MEQLPAIECVRKVNPRYADRLQSIIEEYERQSQAAFTTWLNAPVGSREEQDAHAAYTTKDSQIEAVKLAGYSYYLLEAFTPKEE